MRDIQDLLEFRGLQFYQFYSFVIIIK